VGAVALERLEERHLEDLHRLYQREWWSAGRALEDVRRAVAGSDATIALADEETGRLVAFARVLTDGVYKALVFDVIVEASARESGLGRRLVEAVLAHPRVAAAAHVELYCRPELAGFYRKWGFEEAPGVRLLRRART
jgi:GNAT superfamily N-acetyltransferase